MPVKHTEVYRALVGRSIPAVVEMWQQRRRTGGSTAERGLRRSRAACDEAVA